MVERSIRSVTRSNYPSDRLEIIVVDDGSRDDTFFHMQRLRREFPSLVRLIRFSSNRGKRAALEAGFRDATGEIVVTIDSDSEVEPKTIAEMVTPFLADAQVGGVAGRVAVLNRDTTISRMLEVQYTLAFDFGRAAQSAYRTVACCPGALSAFRRSIILPHLDRVDAPDVPRPAGGPRRGSGADEHRAAAGLRHGLPAHRGNPYAGADDVPPDVAHVLAVGPQLHRRGVQLREVHVHAVPDEEPRAAGGVVRRLEPAPRPLLLGHHRASVHVRQRRADATCRRPSRWRSARSSRRRTTCESSGASGSPTAFSTRFTASFCSSGSFPGRSSRSATSAGARGRLPKAARAGSDARSVRCSDRPLVLGSRSRSGRARSAGRRGRRDGAGRCIGRTGDAGSCVLTVPR